MNSPRSSRRRLALAVVVSFAVVGVFTARLVDIQIVRADQLNEQSTIKRGNSIVTYAPRGQIVDTNGIVLADTTSRYDITAAPTIIAGGFPLVRKAKDGTKTTTTVMDAATQIASITKQDPTSVYVSLTKDPKSNYVLVSNAPVDTASMRAIVKLGIPGLVPQLHPKRTYPDGAVAGNLVGYMNTDGPGGGIERMTSTNSCLKSKNGTTSYQQGGDGVRIPGSSVTTKAAKPGGTVKLTIDTDLNWFAQQAVAEQATAIGAESGTAIVLRVKDAHLMAVADWPSVDPNNVGGSDVASRGSRAFTAQYEPGSVFKAMSSAILVDTGIGNPTSKVVVPSRWTTPEGGFVADATPHAEENLTLTGVLEQSSNVGISKLGIAVPESVRYDYMKKFGLGEPTAVGFLGEAMGSVAPSRGDQTKNPNWDDQTKYNVLYGQGVSASALQVAQIFGTLGNGGVKLPLALVESCTKPDGTVSDVPSTAGTRVVSQATAKTVVNMLESVVDAGELHDLASIPGYRIAGKSGTAEMAANGRYTGDRIVSFAGIAPAEDPQYVVLVTFTKPSTIKTSAAAAPTFKKIMSQVLTKYRVPPSTSPSTYPPTTW